MSDPLIPEPSDWYWRARSAEPRLQEARAAELRQRGVPRDEVARIVADEADQREFEREERVASRHPARFFGPDSPQARQSFRERAVAARRTITRSRQSRSR